MCAYLELFLHRIEPFEIALVFRMAATLAVRTLGLKIALFAAVLTAFELVLLVLSVYKRYQFFRETKGYKGFSLMNVIIRDQILYFILCVPSKG